MSTSAHALADSATMLRRNLRHAMRYPAMTVGVLGMPIVMLLLFVYVFGSTLAAGLGGGTYIDYVTPGIIVITMISGTMSTAVGVCTDMTEGIIARFRTMAIARTSLLTGHVAGAMIQLAVSLVLLFAVALLMGFRPDASPVEWLATIGLLGALGFALTWLAVALGLVCKTPEGASNIVLPLQFLPFLGSAFVPAESMPAGLRWFAEYQPFTPIIETLRGLLLGTPIGSSGMLAVAWCVAITVGGYLWSKALFARDPVR
jgi:ABC-2 type transport system permease protein